MGKSIPAQFTEVGSVITEQCSIVREIFSHTTQ